MNQTNKETKRLIFIKPLSSHCLPRAAGTAGGKPARRAAAATLLATVAPSVSTKTGSATTMSADRVCRAYRAAAVCPCPQPPPARPPPTQRALLQDPCPVWWEELAEAVEVFLPAPKRAAPAVPPGPRLQPPPLSWMLLPADARRSTPPLWTDGTHRKTKLRKYGSRPLVPLLLFQMS